MLWLLAVCAINIQSSSGATRNTVSLSSLRGVGGKYFYNMEEVEVAMGANDGCNLSEVAKEHVRSGPCGATWIKKISEENTGAASSLSKGRYLRCLWY